MCHEVAVYRWLVQVLTWGVAALVGTLVYVGIAWWRAPIAADAPWYERHRGMPWRMTGLALIGMLGYGPLWTLHCGPRLSLVAVLTTVAVAFTPAFFALRLLPSAPRRAPVSLSNRLRSLAYVVLFMRSTWWALVLPIVLTEALGSAAAFIPSVVAIVVVMTWQLIDDRVAPRGRAWPPWSEALSRAATALGVDTPDGGVIPLHGPNVLGWSPQRVEVTEGLARACADDPLALEGAARVALGRLMRLRWRRTTGVVEAAALGTIGVTPAFCAFAGVDGRAAGYVALVVAVGLGLWSWRKGWRGFFEAAEQAPVPVRRFQMRLAEYVGGPVVYAESSRMKGPYDVLVEAGAPPAFPRPAPPMSATPSIVAWFVAMQAALATFAAVSAALR